MSAEFSERAGRLIISVAGDIDHHSSQELRGECEREIARRGAVNGFEFDLSGVNFMDSSGVGLILGRCKTAREYGGSVVITGACERVRKILEISGVGKVAKIDNTGGKSA